MGLLSIDVETFAIALLLVGLMVWWIVIFAIVAEEIVRLMSLARSKRSDKLFFKKIERFRRDFS